MKTFTSLLILVAMLSSCERDLTDPQIIVDNAIEAAGGDRYLNLHVEYDFRGRHYIAKRKDGIFSYERVFLDSADTIHDFLTNDGFTRKINGEEVTLPDSMAVKYTSSTNSVNYFALLPYGLNDNAVVKKYLGESSINNKAYYNIRVSFTKDGGGEDHEDVFLYWFDKKTFAMDYMAYSFIEDDETSFRFRAAYNPRIVGGVRFQDYVNFKPVDNSLAVEQAESLFKEGKLIELSKIEAENVTAP